MAESDFPFIPKWASDWRDTSAVPFPRPNLHNIRAWANGEPFSTDPTETSDPCNVEPWADGEPFSTDPTETSDPCNVEPWADAVSLPSPKPRNARPRADGEPSSTDTTRFPIRIDRSAVPLPSPKPPNARLRADGEPSPTDSPSTFSHSRAVPSEGNLPRHRESRRPSHHNSPPSTMPARSPTVRVDQSAQIFAAGLEWPGFRQDANTTEPFDEEDGGYVIVGSTYLLDDAFSDTSETFVPWD